MVIYTHGFNFKKLTLSTAVNLNKYIKPKHVKIQEPVFIFFTKETTGKHRGNAREETSVPVRTSVTLCVLCGLFFPFPP
jgi:acyl-coenzyme A synthetase/AMP-(fatty) acid ligase